MKIKKSVALACFFTIAVFAVVVSTAAISSESQKQLPTKESFTVDKADMKPSVIRTWKLQSDDEVREINTAKVDFCDDALRQMLTSRDLANALDASSEGIFLLSGFL